MKRKQIDLNQLTERIEDYFIKFPNLEDAETDKEIEKAKRNIERGIRPTLSGLCYFLGFESTDFLNTLEKRPKFKHLIKKTRLRLTSYWESGLGSGKGGAGCSMWLQSLANDTFKPQQTQANNGLQIIIVGQDGNKAPLQTFLNKPKQIQEVQPTTLQIESTKPKAVQSSPKTKTVDIDNNPNAPRF